MTDACREVIAIRDAEHPTLGVTREETGDDRSVVFLQLAELVFVVGSEDFDVLVYDLASWLRVSDGGQPRHRIPCSTARGAYSTLRDRAVLSQFHWNCGGCGAPIYTVDRRTTGVLECAACGDGGVDFDFHYRHIGEG
jgi:hypothetical protein